MSEMEKRYDFRLLWGSNALWAPTGYGVQAKYILPRLQRLGITCAQFAWYGLQGASIDVDLGEGPLTIYPQGLDAYGNDMYAAYCEEFKADLLVTLLDIWVMPDNFREQINVPWMPWFPVDCAPLPEIVRKPASTAEFPTTYSKFGQREAVKAGLDTFYIPHGVDCNIFKPKDRQDARKRFGVEDDTYIVAMIGANKGFPSRKGFPEAAWAFKAFHDRHPKSLLYLHCNQTGHRGGIDFARMFDAIEDFPKDAVRFVDQTKQKIGLQDSYMAACYNAADVLLQPSYNEGFGIPIIEAQACGCPVIVNDNTSMSELVGPGIAVPPLQPNWFGPGGWAGVPDIAGFTEALETMYQDRGSRREASREFALQYDWDRVVEEHWIPVLDRVWDQVRRAKGHEHQWLPTGVFDHERNMHVPCRVNDCPADMIVRPDGKRHARSSGFEMRIAGVDLDIEDDPNGAVAKVVCREATYDYDLPSIPLEPGDVVIDIGAQVGVISCYLAKANPGVTVYAYEPVPANYQRLLRNIKANGVEGQVKAFNVAVTGDGRQVELWANTAINSGGGSLYIKSAPQSHIVNSTTLATIMEQIQADTGNDRVKLLKIDCEGSEYEILKAQLDLLRRVDWLVGEMHANDSLQARGWTPSNLLLALRMMMNPEHIRMGVTSLG